MIKTFSGYKVVVNETIEFRDILALAEWDGVVKNFAAYACEILNCPRGFEGEEFDPENGMVYGVKFQNSTIVGCKFFTEQKFLVRPIPLEGPETIWNRIKRLLNTRIL